MEDETSIADSNAAEENASDEEAVPNTNEAPPEQSAGPSHSVPQHKCQRKPCLSVNPAEGTNGDSFSNDNSTATFNELLCIHTKKRKRHRNVNRRRRRRRQRMNRKPKRKRKTCAKNRTKNKTIKRTKNGTKKRTKNRTIKRTKKGTMKQTKNGTKKRTKKGTIKQTMNGTIKRTKNRTKKGTKKRTKNRTIKRTKNQTKKTAKLKRRKRKALRRNRRRRPHKKRPRRIMRKRTKGRAGCRLANTGRRKAATRGKTANRKRKTPKCRIMNNRRKRAARKKLKQPKKRTQRTNRSRKPTRVPPCKHDSYITTEITFPGEMQDCGENGAKRRTFYMLHADYFMPDSYKNFSFPCESLDEQSQEQEEVTSVSNASLSTSSNPAETCCQDPKTEKMEMYDSQQDEKLDLDNFVRNSGNSAEDSDGNSSEQEQMEVAAEPTPPSTTLATVSPSNSAQELLTYRDGNERKLNFENICAVVCGESSSSHAHMEMASTSTVQLYPAVPPAQFVNSGAQHGQSNMECEFIYIKREQTNGRNTESSKTVIVVKEEEFDAELSEAASSQEMDE